MTEEQYNKLRKLVRAYDSGAIDEASLKMEMMQFVMTLDGDTLCWVIDTLTTKRN